MLCASLTIGGETALAAADTPIVIEGVGAAHGFGLAMDGVEGQARAGWSHSRILDLFYPGSVPGRAGGTIRVGLETSSSPVVSVPDGGFISDAPRGAEAGPGFPIALSAGARITLRPKAGGLTIEGAPSKRASAAAPARAYAAEPEPTPGLIPTAPPPPGQPDLEPTPSPGPKQPEPTPSPQGASSDGNVVRTVWMWGNGDPALVAVASTGRRYRGQVEIKPNSGQLVVVNHVDLETYVAGIAEEKGQGWPAAGLEVLAIAARTLGAATMSWYDKNQANGYDICPTANCQLYLGYDGEEPAMSAATAKTAGVIRTHNGRPILAMYHGNGGGQTESYKRVIGANGHPGDPHPYLASVKYPFASPSRWRHRTTLGDIENALRASGAAVPGKIERIGITERGVSPRVLRVRLEGPEGEADISGTTFASALELRSTWFDLGAEERSEAVVTSEGYASSAAAPASFPQRPSPSDRRSPWPAAATVTAGGAALALALLLRRRGLAR